MARPRARKAKKPAKMKAGKPVQECPKAKYLYRRPSGYRKGVRDKVWDQAQRKGKGVVRDPLTGKALGKNRPWDMGHKKSLEFRRLQKSAEKRGLTRKEFLDEHNDPAHYRPELPSSNRCHAGEDMSP